jgi:hypothetical protein
LSAQEQLRWRGSGRTSEHSSVRFRPGGGIPSRRGTIDRVPAMRLAAPAAAPLAPTLVRRGAGRSPLPGV